MFKLIKGIVVLDGVVIVKVYLIVELDLFYDSNEKVIDIESEVEKFNDVIEVLKIELIKIRNNVEV